MVFLGLNMADNLSTRASGTSTTAVWISILPAEAVVGALPRVTALKMVVLPDCGKPIIPNFMVNLFDCGKIWALAGVAELADAHDSNSCSLTGLWVQVPPSALYQEIIACRGVAPASAGQAIV